MHQKSWLYDYRHSLKHDLGCCKDCGQHNASCSVDQSLLKTGIEPYTVNTSTRITTTTELLPPWKSHSTLSHYPRQVCFGHRGLVKVPIWRSRVHRTNGRVSPQLTSRVSFLDEGFQLLAGAELGIDFEQILGQIVSIRVKSLSNTNLVASRDIKLIFKISHDITSGWHASLFSGSLHLHLCK